MAQRDTVRVSDLGSRILRGGFHVKPEMTPDDLLNAVVGALQEALPRSVVEPHRGGEGRLPGSLAVDETPVDLQVRQTPSGRWSPKLEGKEFMCANGNPAVVIHRIVAEILDQLPDIHRKKDDVKREFDQMRKQLEALEATSGGCGG